MGWVFWSVMVDILAYTTSNNNYYNVCIGKIIGVVVVVFLNIIASE